MSKSFVQNVGTSLLGERSGCHDVPAGACCHTFGTALAAFNGFDAHRFI
jgi:hypothetical protein